VTPALRTVDSGGVALATRDYGGSGPALLLMHGAGMDQRSLEPLAQSLRPAFRVLTFDLRGHGSSSSAPWALDAALADIGAVAEAYGVVAPAVGGHSLGGMVAVAYGVEHPSCPGVVNIDGHGRGRPEQYPGYLELEVRQAWERQDRRLDQLTSGVRAVVLRALLRALRQTVVAPETARQVTLQAAAVDLVTMYRRLATPLLVFNAVAPEERRAMKLWAGEGLELVTAYRQGLSRDLAALATERPRTEVVTVDAKHMLIRTHPELVARHIMRFMQAHLPPADARPEPPARQEKA
jgi:pimeloyl-ACP methyl ester carboxylesterase